MEHMSKSTSVTSSMKKQTYTVSTCQFTSMSFIPAQNALSLLLLCIIRLFYSFETQIHTRLQFKRLRPALLHNFRLFRLLLRLRRQRARLILLLQKTEHFRRVRPFCLLSIIGPQIGVALLFRVFKFNLDSGRFLCYRG